MSARRPTESLERARRLLDRWRGWIEELGDHPLDSFEYEGALECRDLLAEALVLAGDERLWDQADELDSQFQAMTVEDRSSPFAVRAPPCWWRQRLPRSDEYRAYLRGDH
jgi:hypothetical protein